MATRSTPSSTRPAKTAAKKAAAKKAATKKPRRPTTPAKKTGPDRRGP